MTPNRYNPSPREQRMSQVATSILAPKPAEATQPALPIAPAAPATPAAAPETAASSTLRIALLQGADIVVSTDAAERQFSTGSHGWGLYGKQAMTIGKPTTIQIGSDILGLRFRQFSSGSWGWNANGKSYVGGHTCQLSINVVVNNSKLLTTPPADGQQMVCQVTVSIVKIHSK